MEAQEVKRDYRSAEAAEYRKLYKSPRWRVIRAHQLQAEPLCRMCKAQKRITAATVCDHIEPHKGDVEKFFAGPFQSLCKPHHDGEKQSDERLGYSKEIGMDGWPVDDLHPVNRKR